MRIPKQSSGVNRSLSHTEKRQPHRINMPGFVNEEIGLGDVIKKTTQKIGFRHCDGCERRRIALNNWVVFSPGRSK
jgi:hypothetical protein